MNKKCLLIVTKDRRKFLTYERNMCSLIEFAKTFHAEIYLATTDEADKIMKLKDLIARVCDSEYSERPKCRKIERVFPKNKKDRKTILSDAVTIRGHIRKTIMNGKPVSLKDLKEKFKKKELTDACLCNHLSVVRKELASAGVELRRTGAGEYCLTKS